MPRKTLARRGPFQKCKNNKISLVGSVDDSDLMPIALKNYHKYEERPQCNRVYYRQEGDRVRSERLTRSASRVQVMSLMTSSTHGRLIDWSALTISDSTHPLEMDRCLISALDRKRRQTRKSSSPRWPHVLTLLSKIYCAFEASCLLYNKVIIRIVS
jgi:hypothetical protein